MASQLRSHEMDSAAFNRADVHRGSLFLRKLPTSDLRRLEPYLEIREWARDEIIQGDGDVITRMLFPHNMTLALLGTVPDGTTVEIATVGTEGYLGVESLLGSATAIGIAVSGGGRASTIALEQMLILASQMPSLRAAMLEYARSYLALVFKLAACNAVHTLKQRTCRRLLLALDQTEQTAVALTQDDLARALGVGRTSVNQVCKELRDANLISYSRGLITINSVAELTETACDCYQSLKQVLSL